MDEEQKLANKFLLIHQDEVVDVFETYQEAIDEGAKRFGSGKTGMYGRVRRKKHRKNGKWFVHEAIYT
jgi:hypothetical protein